MPTKYRPTDDGSVVDGRIVVYMGQGPQSTALLDRSAKARLAKATAAAMTEAAASGAALCEDCAQAQRDREKK